LKAENRFMVIDFSEVSGHGGISGSSLSAMSSICDKKKKQPKGFAGLSIFEKALLLAIFKNKSISSHKILISTEGNRFDCLAHII